MIYYSALAFIGVLLNTWLYIDDMKNRNGILNKVDKGDEDEKNKKVSRRPVSQDYSDITSLANSAQ